MIIIGDSFFIFFSFQLPSTCICLATIIEKVDLLLIENHLKYTKESIGLGLRQTCNKYSNQLMRIHRADPNVNGIQA